MSKRKTPGNPGEGYNKKLVDMLMELSEFERNVERQPYKANAYKKAAVSIAKHPAEIKSGDEAKELVSAFLNSGHLF
jgi:hypothetical protein